MSVSKGSLLHRIFVKFFQEFVLVLVLLKVSCHDPGIDKMMCDNEDSWRQDSSAQTCPFDACHRKSPSFPSLGPCSTHWPCSTSEMRTWRGYLAYFLQFFPKSGCQERSPSPFQSGREWRLNPWWEQPISGLVVLVSFVTRDNFASWTENIFGALSSALPLKEKMWSVQSPIKLFLWQ